MKLKEALSKAREVTARNDIKMENGNESAKIAVVERFSQSSEKS